VSTATVTLNEFFASLFPNLSAGYIELRALPSKAQMAFTEPDLIADMQREFLIPHSAENIYFGVATRIEKDGTLAGGAKHCGAFHALFIDYDFKETSEEDALALLAVCPVRPSIVISSGGGLHVYWLLREPIAAAEGTSWLRRLSATMRSDCAATDAARILRVPGTMNYKYDPPRPVTIEVFRPDRRYALDEFAWLIPDPRAAHVNGDRNGFRELRCRTGLMPIDMIAEFEKQGLYIRELREGKHAVTCPWASEHSCDSGETQAVIWPPNNEHDLWGFKCLHQHKGVARTIADVIKLFGVDTAPTPDAEDDPGGERYTDMANAARLAEEAAGRVAHAQENRDYFYIFDGVRLNLEAKTAVVPFVEKVARRLYAEANALADKAQRRQKEHDGTGGNMSQDAAQAKKVEIERLVKNSLDRRAGAARLESRDGAYAAIELVKARPSIRIKMDQLDAHPTWLNTPSGTLDLDTGEVWPHRLADYMTKVTGAAYDPTATAPRWEAFLLDVLPDPEVRAFMQRSVGYALTDFIDEHCLWFLYGLGRNGKTTFINAVRAVLGDYAASTKASTLMVKSHGDERRNDVAVLRGARFVSATEAEDGQQLAEALIKEVTGGDPVTARRLYAEFFTFQPTFKIILAANHKPVVRGTDLGIWRRIHLVPFEVIVAEDKVDRGLPAALAAEASGILNWAITGFRAWREGGLQPPEAVRAATAAYRAESDPLGEFFDERIVIEEGGAVPASTLYGAYQQWASQAGIKFPLTQQKLGMALEGRGFHRHKGAQGARSWRGLRLRALAG
jgi:putative DNA primase/helicase